MGEKTVRRAGALLAALGLGLGVSWCEPQEPAPAKAAVEVTYYYLPG